MVLIKKWGGAMTDDAHRVRETIRRIGIVQQLLDVVAPTYKVRDEIRQPRDRNGGKNYTGRTHTQTVRGEPRSSGDLERCVARNGCDGCCGSAAAGFQKLTESNTMVGDDLARSPLAKVLPPLQESLRNLLGVQCEDQVISPVAIDMQIARTEPLGPET